MKIEKEEVAPPLAPSMTKIVSHFLPSHKIGFAERKAPWIARLDYCFTTTTTTVNVKVDENKIVSDVRDEAHLNARRATRGK